MVGVVADYLPIVKILTAYFKQIKFNLLNTIGILNCTFKLTELNLNFMNIFSLS